MLNIENASLQVTGTSAPLTVVNITVNNIFLGGSWSRPSGNTGRVPHEAVLPDDLDRHLL